MSSRRITTHQGAAEVAAWQLKRLQEAGMLRTNPSKKKKVPAYMKETPRSAAKGVSVFPRRKEAWPIGDLFHARLALIYAMAPTHRSQRAAVIKAVAKYYPEYKWATWWNKEIKKPKKDSTLKTWGTYLKQRVSRAGRGSWEQSDSRTKHRNRRKKNPAKGLTAWQKFVRKKARAAKAAGKATPDATALSVLYHREEAKKCKIRHASKKKKPTRKKAPAKKKPTAKGKGKRPSKTAYLNTKAKDYPAFQKEMARKYPGAGIQSGETGDMWQKIKAHRAKKRKK